MLLDDLPIHPIPWPLPVSSQSILETQLALEKLHLVFSDLPSPSRHTHTVQAHKAACYMTVTASANAKYHTRAGMAILAAGPQLGELLWTRQPWVHTRVICVAISRQRRTIPFRSTEGGSPRCFSCSSLS